MRPRRPASRPRPPRCFAGWGFAGALLLLAAGSCLNPQPDPFPQASEDSLAIPGATGDSMPAGAMPAADPAERAPVPAPPPEPDNAGAPAANPIVSAEGEPAPEPDAGAPAPDAGADAGRGEGPLVGDD